MIKVDFMVIGAMKCGTTSLCQALEEHPEVCFSDPKETHFFYDADWRKRAGEYDAFFAHRREYQLLGEGSTTYTSFPHGNPHIATDLKAYNPQLKFIYLIRHPFDRIKSHYIHAYLRGFEKREINRAIRENPIYTDVSRHYMQIEQYLEAFGRENIYIITYEALIRDWPGKFKEIQNFLGLSEQEIPLPLINPTKDTARIDHKVTHFLQSDWANTYKRILPKPIRSAIGKGLLAMGKRRLKEDVQLSQASREFIWEIVGAEIEEIALIMSEKNLYRFK